MGNGVGNIKTFCGDNFAVVDQRMEKWCVLWIKLFDDGKWIHRGLSKQHAFDEFIQISIQHPVYITDFHVGPMVFYHTVWV